MALVRVYCGVATAEMAPWLTVAVVDDSGRLLDMRHISDDPAGYAYLGALLADRSGGSAPVAIDRHEHLVAQLLAAANRPLAIADEHDPERLRRAVRRRHLLRRDAGPAVAAPCDRPGPGAAGRCPLRDRPEPLAGTWTSSSRCSSAHAAVTAGRQAAAVALREVLRELYPAALRAYPDPAEFIPLHDPRRVARAGPADRARRRAAAANRRARRGADRERRHRHRHCRQRHHRAARRGRGVARLERQPAARARSSPRRSGRPSPRSVHLTRPWRRWSAVSASGSMRLPAGCPPESCIPPLHPFRRQCRAGQTPRPPPKCLRAELRHEPALPAPPRPGSASQAASAPPLPTASRRRGPSRATRPGTAPPTTRRTPRALRMAQAPALRTAQVTARPMTETPERRTAQTTVRRTARTMVRRTARTMARRTAQAMARRTARTMVRRTAQAMALRMAPATARRSGTTMAPAGSSSTGRRRPTARTRCPSVSTR